MCDASSSPADQCTGDTTVALELNAMLLPLDVNIALWMLRPSTFLSECSHFKLVQASNTTFTNTPLQRKEEEWLPHRAGQRSRRIASVTH